MTVSDRVGVKQTKREARQKRHSQRKLWRLQGARSGFGLLVWGLVGATFVGMTIHHLRSPDPVASFKRQIENSDEKAARLKAEQEGQSVPRDSSAVR